MTKKEIRLIVEAAAGGFQERQAARDLERVEKNKKQLILRNTLVATADF